MSHYVNIILSFMLSNSTHDYTAVDLENRPSEINILLLDNLLYSYFLLGSCARRYLLNFKNTLGKKILYFEKNHYFFRLCYPQGSQIKAVITQKVPFKNLKNKAKHF